MAARLGAGTPLVVYRQTHCPSPNRSTLIAHRGWLRTNPAGPWRNRQWSALGNCLTSRAPSPGKTRGNVEVQLLQGHVRLGRLGPHQIKCLHGRVRGPGGYAEVDVAPVPCCRPQRSHKQYLQVAMAGFLPFGRHGALSCRDRPTSRRPVTPPVNASRAVPHASSSMPRH